MNKSAFAKITVVILLLVAAGIATITFTKRAERRSLEEEISMYSGDGRMKNASFTFFMDNVLGYTIQFDDFPMDQRHEEVYLIKNLPDLQNYPYIYLKSCGENRENPQGSFALTVADGSGNIVTKLGMTRLEDLVMSSNGGDPCYYLYDEFDSKLKTKVGETYTLSVQFEPDGESNSGMTGSIWMRCGGSL